MAPYRHRISSQTNCEISLAVSFFKALPSEAPDKSSRAATINLKPRPLGMYIQSKYIRANSLAGADIRSGLWNLAVLRTWHSWQELTCRRMSFHMVGQKNRLLMCCMVACSPRCPSRSCAASRIRFRLSRSKITFCGGLCVFRLKSESPWTK